MKNILPHKFCYIVGRCRQTYVQRWQVTEPLTLVCNLVSEDFSYWLGWASIRLTLFCVIELILCYCHFCKNERMQHFGHGERPPGVSCSLGISKTGSALQSHYIHFAPLPAAQAEFVTKRPHFWCLQVDRWQPFPLLCFASHVMHKLQGSFKHLMANSHGHVGRFWNIPDDALGGWL